jgi:REP element-mobilizing transposase RayT
MITSSSRKVLGKRRCRKNHVQLEMAIRVDKNGQRRGGKRKGAGRPKKGVRASERHKTRPEINPRHPQHVTLRVVGAVGYLRKPHMFRAIRRALVTIMERVEADFRIVHFSVQGNHLHLVCEADSKRALASGMKAFECAAAQYLNQELSRERGEKRRGPVFADRYHVRAMSSVRQTRNCLNYVLNNWRHHGLTGPSLFEGKLDYYSSAVFFPGWKERTTSTIHIPPDYDPPAVSRPQTWLLNEAWKRAKPISVFETPRA